MKSTLMQLILLNLIDLITVIPFEYPDGLGKLLPPGKGK